MGLLSKNRGESDVPVWKDENGIIRCPGDSCKKECDNTCPIFLNTAAITMSKIGHSDEAKEIYEKALEIEPEFYDAWNNLGAIWGQSGNYQKAHDCYLKAHNINPEKTQPLFGLALSSRDLKLFEECIKWCDEYDKLCSDGRCNQARSDAIATLGKSSASVEDTSEIPSPMDICMELLPMGKEDGYILSDDTFPNIPEIMFQARSIVTNLFDDLRKEPTDNLVHLTLGWSTYAAMGAVKLWHDDWDGVKKKGLYESLVEPRGIDEMDEYVTDIIGWKYGSQKANDFMMHRFMVSTKAIAASRMTEYSDMFVQYQCFINAAMAMYYYGMIIEMNELGMK